MFIVKTIVEAHDGTVAVESDEGIGTTFTILLPRCENSRVRSEAAAAVQQTDAAASKFSDKQKSVREELLVQ